MNDIKDFERPIQELEEQIENLELFGEEETKDKELQALRRKLAKVRKEIFSNLTTWQVVQLARHPKRPHALDYLEALFTEFQELHGDRRFADDPAVIAGFARFEGRPVCFVGQEKGRDTKDKIYRNFGMPKPEGYRKALRVMKLAEKFGIPVLTFIDTPGAYPGMDAEERGQAEAIAFNLREMANLKTPVVVTVIGEGGSGGALALGIGDKVNMLQYSVYSVISPEGCAAILWKDAGKAEEAAAALKLTAPDLLKFKLIDRVIEEPLGGVHVDPPALYASLADAIREDLDALSGTDAEELLEQRYEKFRVMGAFAENNAARSSSSAKGKKNNTTAKPPAKS
ncbi:MAG: acetyl-CoA carboxylase carboxyltransferase subunit alpha [Acidobacteriota bacterium]|jgi:acetyl-CoA carboxylase carboxyl transferase subunit alpha